MESMPRLQLFFLCLTFLLMSCSQDNDRSSFRLQVNKPYGLREWPDSNFVANLDSIAGAELVRPTQRPPVEITLNPLGGLPRQTSTANSPTPGTSVTPPQNSPEAAVSPEEFLRNFIRISDEIRLEPGRAGLTVEVQVKPGEDLPTLLHRHYGVRASSLPRFVVLSQLQGIHHTLDLENLRPGDKIILPRIP